MTSWRRNATFDASRSYRYLLTRERVLASEPVVQPALFPKVAATRPEVAATRMLSYQMPQARADSWLAFVMLNPSTADADSDDPTMRKVMGFAGRWGFRRLRVVNLFARVSTDPRALRPKAPDYLDPMGGPEADIHIMNACQAAALVVVAWGRLPGRWAAGRAREMLQLIGGPLYCLGTTADGQPRHPLMLAYDEPLRAWSPGGEL